MDAPRKMVLLRWNRLFLAALIAGLAVTPTVRAESTETDSSRLTLPGLSPLDPMPADTFIPMPLPRVNDLTRSHYPDHFSATGAADDERRREVHDLTSGAVTIVDEARPPADRDGAARPLDPMTQSQENGTGLQSLPGSVRQNDIGLLSLTPLEGSSNTSAAPWRFNTKLFMRAADGTNWICSASMIGPRHAITAGHCVFMHDHGGMVRSIEVIPGYQRGSRPYGSASATHAVTWSGWTRYADFDYDMALLLLDRRIGDTVGWYGVWDPSCASATAYTVPNISYPGSPFSDGETQYQRSGTVDRCTGTEHRFSSPSYGGQSGSSFYLKYPELGRYVVSILSHGPIDREETVAIRITPDYYDAIVHWKAENP